MEIEKLLLYNMQNYDDKIRNLEPFYQENAFNVRELNQIFSWNELERLLNLRPFVNNKRFNIMSNKSYKWDTNPWLSDVNTYPPSLIEQEIKNSLCFITDCSRVTKGVNNIAKHLEDLTNSSVDAHIFFSLTNDKQGFGIHSDNSHNFILQIEGETNFKVWNKEDTDRLHSIDKLDYEPYIDVIMKPGDCIFIPAYLWHIAESCTKRLSVSFPMTIYNNGIKEDRNWIELRV